ncbi:TrmB family transcriptional regulator [Halolamina sp.]|uniref:TrmB family transcriptional regulator n=1 Tax=Halolamina sp. TaxID=1940283 RepID=UPI003564F280
MTDTDLFSVLNLTEYEEAALRELLHLGQSSAPDLAEATSIPKARIYSVLDSLANQGYVKVIPGRPKQYQAKHPDDLVEQALESRRQEFESYREQIESVREEFLAEYEPIYDQAADDIRPTEELFYVVDVGEPSQRETRALYESAESEIRVLTKSFGYVSEVESALADAVERGVSVSALLLAPRHLLAENRRRQTDIIDYLHDSYPEIELRFSDERMPWRGTLIDPSMEYDSGEATFLVEQEEVANHLRQAAVTENAAFVAGFARYFNLIWEYESSRVRQ